MWGPIVVVHNFNLSTLEEGQADLKFKASLVYLGTSNIARST